MKLTLNLKLFLTLNTALLLTLASCSKQSEKPNNGGSNDNTKTTSVPTIESVQPNQAYAGDTVIINGTNYSSILTDNAVRFNGTDATVIAATATQLKVKVPQNGTTGAIGVKVKSSAYVTGGGVIFTYLSPVTVSSISPVQASVGQKVTITGTNFSYLISQQHRVD